MASLFFQDYHFPQELYNKDTGDFTTPIRTLLDFTPHILQELPKNAEDQKPIKSEDEDTYTNAAKPSSSWKNYLKTIVASERSKALAEFVMRCGSEYLKTSNEKAEFERFEKEYQREKRRERRQRRRRREAEAEAEAEARQRQTAGGWFNFRTTAEESPIASSSSDEEEELEELLKKERRRRQREEAEKDFAMPQEKRARTEQSNSQPSQQQQQQQLAKSTTTFTIAKSAAAASVLSLSLYSTYQASLKFSEISFHNQLEILIDQVQSIVQSTKIWIDEHEALGDPVPDRVRKDLIQIEQIMEYLIRLDPRSTKKIEAAGWGCGAIGGLSALGGFALGSATVITGGAALALGGVAVMISSKASRKSQLGARLLLENQVRERVSSCQKAIEERKRVIDGFVVAKQVKVEAASEEWRSANKRKNRVSENIHSTADRADYSESTESPVAQKKRIPLTT